jgi:hypothetical protein
MQRKTKKSSLKIAGIWGKIQTGGPFEFEVRSANLHCDSQSILWTVRMEIFKISQLQNKSAMFSHLFIWCSIFVAFFGTSATSIWYVYMKWSSMKSHGKYWRCLLQKIHQSLCFWLRQIFFLSCNTNDSQYSNKLKSFSKETKQHKYAMHPTQFSYSVLWVP